MANWTVVENNQITEYYDLLPLNWRHVSGLRLSENDLPFLKSLGWYPVVKQHQSYDVASYEISGYNYTIAEDSVIETVQLQLRPVSLPSTPADFKYLFMTELRRQRNQRLADSDWTQLADVKAAQDQTIQAMWTQYRQQLRDLPSIYADLDVLNINDVQWPLPNFHTNTDISTADQDQPPEA